MTRARFDEAFAAAGDLHQANPVVAEFTSWDKTARFQHLAPRMIPVAATLPADKGLRDGAELDSYAAFCALAPSAHWLKTYKDADIGHTFNQKFGSYQLIGAQGHFFSLKLNSYVLYAERGLFYPWHHHPAEELYVIIAGHAKFEAAGKKTRQLGPGDTIFHASNQPHAMTTEDRPVMAYVLWRGNLKTRPVLTPKAQLP